MSINSNLLKLVLIFSFSCTVKSTIHGQIYILSQWENISQLYNPSLSGNFEGQARLRATHRNQWRSILGKNSFKTSFLSFDYNFNLKNNRKFTLGTFSVFDVAGASNFRTNSINMTGAISQSLGERNVIVLGVNAGTAVNKIDLENLVFAGNIDSLDLREKKRYFNFSTGLNWCFQKENGFKVQIGSGLYHLNRPDVSLSKNSVSRLELRYTIHGKSEIPINRKFSFEPSVLYFAQGSADQFLFGLNNKIYLSTAKSNVINLGLFARTSNNFSGTEVNIFVFSSIIELNTVYFGFAFDRFQGIESNAFEFSIGYRIK